MLSFRVKHARSRLLCTAIAAGILPFAGLSSAQTNGPSVTINSSVALVESAQASGPVKRATQDLRHDFATVFGTQPRLVNSLSEAGPVAILIAQRDHVPAGVSCATTMNREAFAFSLAEAGGARKQRVVCLTGADMRGTIYAIYQFSQQYLGVDPMYLWTGKQPEKRSSLTLPADFTHTFPSPVFHYRGFFINDEDLLTGWRPPAKGVQSGISLKTWDMVFETILRLKGNMVVPGTWIFPNDAQVHAAAERGLIINQHHAIPLGVNVARWPKGVPYNFSTHPETLERAWKDAVAEYQPGDDILWSVGLRGLSDQSYSAVDPSVRNNDPLLGKRISEAIADQVKIVRAKYPHAQFVTDLWQEGARLMRENYLKIPPGVTKVWADTGYGDMQDGGDLAPGEGMYIHTAMMNANANQLTEMVPVSVLQEEIGRYIKAGATGYLLVNTSDIRPVVMTTEEVMNLAWGGMPKATTDADGAYYRQWATKEFGAKSADAMEKVFKEYFAAPALRRSYRMPRRLTSAGIAPPRHVNYSRVPREDGDNHYHTEARRLILEKLSGGRVVAVPSQSPKWRRPGLLPNPDPAMFSQELANDVQDCSTAQPRWDKVWHDAVAAEPLVAPSRRQYYQAEVLTMITINRESNRMLLEVARSLQDYDAGNLPKAKTEANEALQALAAVRKSMDAAEYGKWKNWYCGDWLTGVYRTHQVVQDWANHLNDPMAKLPAPAVWNGWEAYFHIMAYEGNRDADVK